MSLCLLSAGSTLLLSISAFSLSWTHSVEKVRWQEEWHISQAGLELTMARVKGSGAGMEPGDDAVLTEGWWQWQPDLPPQKELRLAASGATGTGWTLCHTQACLELAAQAGEPVRLWACDRLEVNVD